MVYLVRIFSCYHVDASLRACSLPIVRKISYENSSNGVRYVGYFISFLSYLFFSSQVLSSLRSRSVPKITQIWGHTEGPSPPSPLRHVPSFLSREKFSTFSPRRLASICSLPTLLGALNSRSFLIPYQIYTYNGPCWALADGSTLSRTPVTATTYTCRRNINQDYRDISELPSDFRTCTSGSGLGLGIGLETGR